MDNMTMESAKIEERSAELKVENVRLNIETNVANAVETHLRALEALEVAEGNEGGSTQDAFFLYPRRRDGREVLSGHQL